MTLLPSAAALLSVTFHDPGSLQLLSGWKTRYSSTCDILEFQPGSSFAPSSGKGKRESADDVSLLLGTSDEDFVSLFRWGWKLCGGSLEAAFLRVARQLCRLWSRLPHRMSTCPLVVSSHEWSPTFVFVVVTGSAAAALKCCTALVSLPCVLSWFPLCLPGWSFPWDPGGQSFSGACVELHWACSGTTDRRSRAWCFVGTMRPSCSAPSPPPPHALVVSTTSPSGAQQAAAALSKLVVFMGRCLGSRFAFAEAKVTTGGRGRDPPFCYRGRARR